MREAAITPVNSRWNIPVITVIDLYCDLLSVRAHERSFNPRFTTGRLVLCWFTVSNTPPQALRICVCWMCVCACFCLCEIENGSSYIKAAFTTDHRPEIIYVQWRFTLTELLYRFYTVQWFNK